MISFLTQKNPADFVNITQKTISKIKQGANKMPLVQNIENEMSESDYLKSELISDIKHEYINGYVYAMAGGASENHGLILQNMSREIGNSLIKNKSSCNVLSSDMKVRINDKSTNYFYPDVVVFCDRHEHDTEYYKHSPIIVVEVLSKSTRKNDKTSKKLTYFNIPTLQEYVVIEQDTCEVEVFRKSEGWKSSVYFLGDKITFNSINATISVEDIYYHINNDDITAFLKEKEYEENR